MPKAPSIADQLERASHDLDLLIRDARLEPHPSAARFDGFEERAQAIAAALVAAYRGRGAPVTRVLKRTRSGGVWL